MIQIKNLENIDSLELVETFNLAFADYMVPMTMTESQLMEKMRSEGISLKYSVGAFDNNKLVAFVLHCKQNSNGHLLVYNSGTGVIPAFRGNGLTKKMYDYLLPIFEQDQVAYVLLEVIDSNVNAINSYEKIGFIKTRKLRCFKGIFSAPAENARIKVQSLQNYNWNVLTSFWDFRPSWQNTTPVLDAMQSITLCIGAFFQQTLVGYLIYNPSLKRVNSFAVSKQFRQQSVGNLLFDHIAKEYDRFMSLINIDDAAYSSLSFLEAMGLKNSINQYEMILPITMNKLISFNY